MSKSDVLMRWPAISVRRLGCRGAGAYCCRRRGQGQPDGPFGRGGSGARNVVRVTAGAGSGSDLGRCWSQRPRVLDPRSPRGQPGSVAATPVFTVRSHGRKRTWVRAFGRHRCGSGGARQPRQLRGTGCARVVRERPVGARAGVHGWTPGRDGRQRDVADKLGRRPDAHAAERLGGVSGSWRDAQVHGSGRHRRGGQAPPRVAVAELRRELEDQR